MPEEVAGQPGSGASNSPALSQDDIDKLIQDRIAGFQRLLDREQRERERVESELTELKTASLSEEEQEQLAQTQKDRRIAELEAKLELRELSKDYPTEIGYFEQLLAADSAKSQLEVMRAYAATFQPKAPEAPAAPAAAPDAGSPEIDLNRSMRKQFEGITMSDGRIMNEQLADAILGSVGRQADVTQKAGS